MQKRRLAAIMFTDIVGYTSLMDSDKDRAFEVLRKNREIHIRFIEQFDGTLIKEMGDGMLISFDLAADAVHCAVEIQKMSKDEMEAQIRIGIHSGDITFENEDVFGDGVNLASRLHSIADPGGIYISESLQKSIRSKSDINTKYLGEFKLKNVDYPVRTYAILGDGLPVPSTAKIYKLSRKSLKQRIFGSTISYIVFLLLLVSSVWLIRGQFFSEKTSLSSLLVLPFENYTGDDDLEYFVAGMHSSLIGDIGKISDLRVISKTTSRAYKNSEMSLPEIASELGINTVVEASVLCLGDSVCFQVKVMSAYPEEKQLWVQDYYVEKSQILNLYNRVTKEISETIDVVLTPEETEILAESRTVDPEAYDAYLKGQYYWEKLDKESMQLALKYFQLAIEKDPGWADPYAGMANAWGMFGTFFRALPKSETLPKVNKYLNKALELDPNSVHAHYVKAISAVWAEFDWEQGEVEFLKSLSLNPNDALCHMYYAHLLMILSRSDEAVSQANQALELDPLSPLILGLYGVVMKNEENYESAIEYFEKAISIDPNFGFARGNLYNIQMFTAYENGDYETWIESWEKKVHGFGHWNDEGTAAVLQVFHEKGHIAAIEEMFKMNEKYGKDCFMSAGIKAERYIKLKEYDKAMDCLEKDYVARDMQMAYVATKVESLKDLHNNPRFIQLLQEMNLPLPK